MKAIFSFPFACCPTHQQHTIYCTPLVQWPAVYYRVVHLTGHIKILLSSIPLIFLSVGTFVKEMFQHLEKSEVSEIGLNHFPSSLTIEKIWGVNY